MATLGTRLKTWLTGKLVGEDKYGNRYYTGKPRPGYARPQRWVIYKGMAEASKVPPEWHGWLHFMTDTPLDEANRRPWQKDHVPNLTGTRAAYHPPGSVLGGGQRRRAVGDYEPWSPE